MSRTELELLREGVVVRVVPVGTGPLHLGRDLDNSVVLTDEDISSRHALITRDADGIELIDLHSTNGTWRNEQRVQRARLADGDELRLGGSCLFRVRVTPLPRAATLVLRDLTAGTAHPVRAGNTHIGSGPSCAVHLPDGPARRATVTVHDGGELWLDAEEGERSLTVGERFEVGGHTFEVAVAADRSPATVDRDGSPYADYRLVVALAAPGGPTATLRDVRRGRSHLVTGATRASLLYVLGRQRREERTAGRSEEAAGWMDDEAVLVAVWGRAGLRQAASGYSVLLHRLRRELDDADFDPSFLEKRRGATRLRLEAIVLEEGV